MRRSLDALDFGRPSRPRQPNMEVLEILGVGEGFCGSACCDEVFAVAAKKAGKREVTWKQVNALGKSEELEKEREKEWNKMETSEAIFVHRGQAAAKKRAEVGENRLLDSRFAYTSEEESGRGKLKARWCIRGYLDPDILELQTASPTLSSEGLAVTLQLIASFGWSLMIADIEAAFLGGENLNRKQGTVLVRPTKDGIPGLDQQDLIELRKPVYGLVDAPRLWWKSLTATLKDLQMEQSKLDSCVFYYRSPDRTISGVISFHVDDLLIGGDQLFMEKVFQPLKAKYPFKHVKHGGGEFLGKVLKQNKDHSITIRQKDYAENIQTICISKERRKQREEPVSELERTHMRAVLDRTCCVLFHVAAESCKSNCARSDWSEQSSCDGSRFFRIRSSGETNPANRVEFAAWSDASFANAQEKKSQGGYLICAVDRGLRENQWSSISPLRWKSFKERQVASTLGAGLLSLSRTIAETTWIRSLWTEAVCKNYTLETDKMKSCQTPIVIAVDCRPAYDHLNNQVMTIKDKRLAIEMLLVRQDVESEGIEVRWVPTDRMLADALTKIGAPAELIRRVLQEQKMILIENDEITRWIGKLKRKVSSWCLLCSWWKTKFGEKWIKRSQRLI